MAYDCPYRLEIDDKRVSDYDVIHYVIRRTGEGEICRGTNFNEMRNLVDRANEAALHTEDRGR